MAQKQTTIQGYTVDLDTDMEDGVTGCWISKGKFAASLECADDQGGMEDDDGMFHRIKPDTLTAIRELYDRRIRDQVESRW